METWTEVDCTIEHEGRKFSAGGGHVDPVYLIAYPARDPQEHFAADMLSAALSEVNFEEIAAHYVADCGYEAPEPEGE